MTATDSTSPTFEVDSTRIGWITFDDPSRRLNVLDEPVMGRLRQAIDEARDAAREGRIRALVVRSGKADSFIAGADVDAIGTIEDPAEAEAKIRLGQSVYNDLEALPVPTVAAIHGGCLGGGLELALACDHRVLSDGKKTMLQLPEVMLGILPAWGGTTRLPRRVGLQASLDILLTGRRIDARKAKRIGLADAILPAGSFVEKVSEFAAGLTHPGLPDPPRRKLLTRLLDDTVPGRFVVLRMARRKVVASTGGHYPAPLKILDVLSATLGKSVEAGLDAEARAAAELVVSPVCKNLIHVFHMREAARKTSGVDSEEVEPIRVEDLGILGAGVMGGGIAQLAAYKGIRVYMKDIRHDAVTGGLQHARELFDKAVERRRLSRREARQHMDLIAGGLEYHGLSAADVVVEAVVERMDVKREVLRETESHVRPDAVIATNTSSLSVDEMAAALARPERFCGMHFFNPVHRMPLVEVIRGTHTSGQAVATVYALALELGKVPVIVGDGPGFLVNRILGPYLNEAGFLLGEGARVDVVDGVAKTFGMPMGPLRLIDEVGIDVSRHAGESLYAALGGRLSPSPALVVMGETGRLGRKGGAGFYSYEKGREKGVDESVYELLASVLPEPVELDPEQIRTRLFALMINEAALILDEGIARSAADVDLAMIMGTGFPPFRGGLLRFADSVHPRALLDTIKELHERHGDRFSPAPLLARLASEERSFYEAFPA